MTYTHSTAGWGQTRRESCENNAARSYCTTLSSAWFWRCRFVATLLLSQTFAVCGNLCFGHAFTRAFVHTYCTLIHTSLVRVVLPRFHMGLLYWTMRTYILLPVGSVSIDMRHFRNTSRWEKGRVLCQVGGHRRVERWRLGPLTLAYSAGLEVFVNLLVLIC